MLELFLIFLVAVSGLICFIVLLIVGYREQIRRITISANRNAGYWAQSESDLDEARGIIQDGKAILSQYDQVLALYKKRGDDFQRIAGEALLVARAREFGGVPMVDGPILMRDPNETYAMEIIDPILDAEEIG